MRFRIHDRPPKQHPDFLVMGGEIDYVSPSGNKAKGIQILSAYNNEPDSHEIEDTYFEFIVSFPLENNLNMFDIEIPDEFNLKAGLLVAALRNAASAIDKVASGTRKMETVVDWADVEIKEVEDVKDTGKKVEGAGVIK